MNEIYTQCCVCRKYRTDLGWSLSIDLDARCDRKEIKVSHGYCDDCYETEIAKLDAEVGESQL